MTEVIGEGQYGCVINPVIPCVDKQVRIQKEDVGKIYYRDDMYVRENRFHELLKKYDKKSSFTIPYVGSCRIRAEDVALLKNKCRIPMDKKIYHQIILGYGGDNMRTILEGESSWELFLKIFLSLNGLLEGIKILQKKEIIHQDIKLENLLYRDGKLLLIDFGLMDYGNKIYVDSNMNLLTYDYPYYPPEYKLYSKVYISKEHFIEDFTTGSLKYSISTRNGPLSILKTVQDCNKEMVKELEEIYELTKKKFHYEKYTDRIDTYSLGIILGLLYKWGTKRAPDTERVKKLRKEIETFLKDLLHMNPIKRLHGKDAYSKYKKIVKNI